MSDRRVKIKSPTDIKRVMRCPDCDNVLDHNYYCDACGDQIIYFVDKEEQTYEKS